MLSTLFRRAAAFRSWARSLTLSPPPQYDSLQHNEPAGDLPANPPPLPPQQNTQQQQQQHRASLRPWQLLPGWSTAASQRATSISTLSGCRTIMAVVTAAPHASAFSRSRRECRGLCTGSGTTSGGGGSSPAQPCPLHACLLRYGITDLAAFSAPRHLALSREVVSGNVEPKLGALAAEGLSSKQVSNILVAQNSPLSCNYADTFQPNLQVLREITAHIDFRPHPKAPKLTAVGKVLAGSPGYVAMYLSRDPSKVQQLLQCLENELGIGLRQLASCSALHVLLSTSASSAQAVISMLLEKEVPKQQIARMTLAAPTLFRRSATALATKLAALGEVLDLDAAAALQLVMVQPNLFSYDIKARLPYLLRFLDGYMGEEGAGRRLVLPQPAVGTLTAAAAKRSTDSLAARGYSQQQIQAMIGKHANLLILNLDSPLQRQKLDWIEQVSPWTLDDFLSVPSYLTYSTRRLAARLALLRECELQLSPTPGDLAKPSNASFMTTVSKRLARQGGKLPCASWAEWEEAWLGTEEGREWGFVPLIL